MGRIKKCAAGFLLAAGILFAGCGRKQPAQVEITVIHGWGSTEDDHVAMRNIYSAFEEKNPDVKLRLISMPTSSEMIRKVEDMITVGEIPDVIFLGGEGRDSIYRFMVENG
ncbi:MAG: ABC transporter substrate-binding protein, partial [Lachnospiraceae bacterium]|nr:ABC transporter substrate-binding protein [Lachnospiraceae bacterium]